MMLRAIVETRCSARYKIIIKIILINIISSSSASFPSYLSPHKYSTGWWWWSLQTWRAYRIQYHSEVRGLSRVGVAQSTPSRFPGSKRDPHWRSCTWRSRQCSGRQSQSSGRRHSSFWSSRRSADRSWWTRRQSKPSPPHWTPSRLYWRRPRWHAGKYCSQSCGWFKNGNLLGLLIKRD